MFLVSDHREFVVMLQPSDDFKGDASETPDGRSGVARWLRVRSCPKPRKAAAELESSKECGSNNQTFTRNIQGYQRCQKQHDVYIKTIWDSIDTFRRRFEDGREIIDHVGCLARKFTSLSAKDTRGANWITWGGHHLHQIAGSRRGDCS